MSISDYRGQHRRSGKARPAIAASISTAFVLGAFASAAPAEAATANDFARLRQCESTGNYRINTGNGYYGAYQFDARTWHGLGLGGLPHQASPATQDAAARRLQSMRGWGPWPGCRRSLGLGAGGSSAPARATSTRASRSTARRVIVAKPAARSTRRLAVGTVLNAPPAPRVRFSLRTSGKPRADVRRWQQQMARRGWTIDVDGYFGRDSLRIGNAFRAQKHLKVTKRTWTYVIWKATWEARVS